MRARDDGITEKIVSKFQVVMAIRVKHCRGTVFIGHPVYPVLG